MKGPKPVVEQRFFSKIPQLVDGNVWARLKSLDLYLL